MSVYVYKCALPLPPREMLIPKSCTNSLLNGFQFCSCILDPDMLSESVIDLAFIWPLFWITFVCLFTGYLHYWPPLRLLSMLLQSESIPHCPLFANLLSVSDSNHVYTLVPSCSLEPSCQNWDLTPPLTELGVASLYYVVLCVLFCPYIHFKSHFQQLYILPFIWIDFLAFQSIWSF